MEVWKRCRGDVVPGGYLTRLSAVTFQNGPQREPCAVGIVVLFSLPVFEVGLDGSLYFALSGKGLAARFRGGAGTEGQQHFLKCCCAAHACLGSHKV